MIYLTSDLHAGLNMKGIEQFKEICGPDDWLLILGDTELFFQETEENKKFSEYFMALTCNIAIMDGNHENFDYFYGLPEEDWNGGRIHRLTKNIIHLMRGYVFELDGKTFFTMGGCKSSKKWAEMGLWWPQENPSAEEIQRAYDNLAQHNNCVDYIFTHKYQPDPNADPLTLEGLVSYIDKNVTFKHYYAGHWHLTKEVDEKHTYVFAELISI